MGALVHAVALSNIRGLGAVFYKELIDRFGSASAVFSQKRSALSENPKVGTFLMGLSTSETNLLRKAERIVNKVEKQQAHIIPYESAEYPTRLKQIPDPPPVLYCNHPFQLNHPRMIAIVGTRTPTAYGKKVVEGLIAGFKQYDVTLVSGLAYGIDYHAHACALEAGVTSIAVMPGGVDSVYPRAHTHTAHAMGPTGGLVSEHPHGTRLDKYLFPARNRITAGLCDAVVVVEAGQKSGSLITAKYANNYHREVFATPGPVNSLYSMGCHDLIRNHQAHLATNMDDVAYIMDWQAEPKSTPAKLCKISSNPALSADEQALMDAVPSHQDKVDIEWLIHTTGRSTEEVSVTVLQLEMKGLVTLHQGRWLQFKQIGN